VKKKREIEDWPRLPTEDGQESTTSKDHEKGEVLEEKKRGVRKILYEKETAHYEGGPQPGKGGKKIKKSNTRKKG